MFNNLGTQSAAYLKDAQQRSYLFWDVLRQAGDQYIAHSGAGKPPVLVFDHELVVDGRSLEHPVNYGLLRIVPPAHLPTNPQARPFVVIDPRAGHGPGVAGSKIHSELGAALEAGHPCYFVSFAPEPVADQEIADVLRAEQYFLQVVTELHPPQKVGKPFLIGNCQGGWALMLLASSVPQLVGPIMLAGAPLSYWAGKANQNPMRYSGGMLGGSWLSSLASDLGNGYFDGISLIDNFENLNPANTFWSKPYHLYANIDTEAERYLGFDRWWSSAFFMTRQEIDWIVQNLFIGNRLSKAELPDPCQDALINPRNIRSPIVVFASEGDNITPPPQALNWILDLYEDEEDLCLHNQTIVYSLHPSIGHLGIFVSSGVATREHSTLFNALDLIELLPPGLYEAKVEDFHPHDPHSEYIAGRHAIEFKPRSFDDIRALDDGRADEQAFQVVERVAAINQHLYDFALSPLVRSLANSYSAQILRYMHPKRWSRYAWSSFNPWALAMQPLVEAAKTHREPVSQDNVFTDLETFFSDTMVRTLDAWRQVRDQSIQGAFYALYDADWLRAALGLDHPQAEHHLHLDRDSALQAELKALRQELTRLQVNEGGAVDAFARILIYMADEDTFVDERVFNLIKQLSREDFIRFPLPPLEQIKIRLRKQWAIMQQHPQAAIEAIPKLVPNSEQRQAIWDVVVKVAELKDLSQLSAAAYQRYEVVACALGLCSQWEPPVVLQAPKENTVQAAQSATKSATVAVKMPVAKKSTKVAKKAPKKTAKAAKKAKKKT